MKIAVIYYSYKGNTAFLCREIVRVLHADEFVVECEENGFFSIVKQLFTKKLPKICDSDFKVDNYDKIVLGAPCWAWDVAPAMKSFLKKYPIKNKEVALLLCHGGGASDKTFEKWISILGENKVVAKLKLVNPLEVQTARALSFAADWAQDLWEETT